MLTKFATHLISAASMTKCNTCPIRYRVAMTHYYRQLTGLPMPLTPLADSLAEVQRGHRGVAIHEGGADILETARSLKFLLR
ncbi:hypothetical protein SAMN04487959_1382 [Modicisalibacter xianhensis]|uniref:Uncharacterized protein n=2 Tax=Modicisalibacter xianhensis TaxID=442341 RepID=A0A1I3GPQ1_9GAMM|nr:hypothetical protein SAMN04487959_1382 [Halomonas xianhensis]